MCTTPLRASQFHVVLPCLLSLQKTRNTARKTLYQVTWLFYLKNDTPGKKGTGGAPTGTERARARAHARPKRASQDHAKTSAERNPVTTKLVVSHQNNPTSARPLGGERHPHRLGDPRNHGSRRPTQGQKRSEQPRETPRNRWQAGRKGRHSRHAAQAGTSPPAPPVSRDHAKP